MMTAFINAMEAYGTTQKLADDSGIPVQTIKRIKNGETASPGLETIVPLARAMGISLDEMFGLGYANEAAAEGHIDNPSLPCHGNGSCGIVRKIQEMYENQIAYQRKIFKVLACVCGVLMAFIIALFTYDVLSPGIGWFRYQTIHGLHIPSLHVWRGKFDSFI